MRQKPEAPPAAAHPGPRSVAGLAALGFVAALVSVFLWLQLVLARSGGPSVCGPEDGGCGALWDGSFARSVQDTTGLPVAAWGLVWALVAFTVPVLELLRQAERGASPGLVAAIRWTAAAGAGAALGLFSASLAAGALCPGCLVIQLVAALYGGIALYAWRRVPFTDGGRGAALAGGLALSAALLLLYPGQKTPAAPSGAGALADAVDAAGARPSATSLPVPAGDAPGTGDPERDKQLQEFVANLQPQAKQALSDSLAIHRAAPAAPPARVRALVGPASAPVRITEWTDVRCPHCADLHETLKYLRENAPRDSFQIEPRQFPLDGACNPAIRQRGDDPVRCLAAKAQICLDGHPRAFDYSGALFARYRSVTAEQVYSLAAPYKPRAELQACVASAQTQATLEEDVREATRHDFDGTPLVLVNGRKGSSFGPFLYAMILTGGRPEHPAFASLPAPRADAHVH
jgi:serine/threonine-protein kinase